MANKKVLQKDVSVELTFMGFWKITAIIDGYLESRLYFGIPKREAIRSFCNEFNKGAKT